MKVSVLGAGLIAGLAVTGCKSSGKSKDPSRDVRDWTLAEIEAELQRNDEALASEGIMIAAATVPTAPTPSPGVEQAAGEEQESIESIESDDGAEAPELVEPEPEPVQDDAPMPAPAAAEPDYAFESEEAVAYERRRGRRSSSRREVPSRCERVCDLAEATCDLETQICELALRHPGEARYVQACERAEQQCVAATRACSRCDD
ncbi:hypothetical protein [Paraliomyxa miuraensis]|uniref:hypothetical protein n=1 Tax=Paraliomyxa miuraensis TaxID=376150 RepID=UPI002257317C|nr:hypothetical protein [Paraliomyxa miuraensis]MCX4246765.1 hypothetical protein [Paraliomyxa miuraensis]